MILRQGGDGPGQDPKIVAQLRGTLRPALLSVGEQALQHAADRVIAAARAAAALWNGREPALTPGVYCGWCPRVEVCPAAQVIAS